MTTMLKHEGHQHSYLSVLATIPHMFSNCVARNHLEYKYMPYVDGLAVKVSVHIIQIHNNSSPPPG